MEKTELWLQAIFIGGLFYIFISKLISLRLPYSWLKKLQRLGRFRNR